MNHRGERGQAAKCARFGQYHNYVSYVLLNVCIYAASYAAYKAMSRPCIWNFLIYLILRNILLNNVRTM